MNDLRETEKLNQAAIDRETRHLTEEITRLEIQLNIPSVSTSVEQLQERLVTLRSLAASRINPDEDWTQTIPITLDEWKARRQDKRAFV